APLPMARPRPAPSASRRLSPTAGAGGRSEPAAGPGSRWLLLLEYDGSRYSGWQKQADARTIQGTLQAAAAAALADPQAEIQGNGRTDAGVHALAYVAHLAAARSLPAAVLRQEINDRLPQDIVLLAVAPAPARFHARHDCLARAYLYRIARRRTAFGKRYVWWVRDHLDVAAMAAAAAPCLGMHDWAAFADTPELRKSTEVLVQRLDVWEREDEILVRVVASHFLWKMVRRLVGLLVEVGRHRLPPPALADLLRQPSDLPARFTAPPSGLFFERAFYHPGELAAFLDASGPRPPVPSFLAPPVLPRLP
ncbi:MAG: tRNA pseudouridine(38-40) synthase TruA, partial [Thermodesulfobacteriota bacterium]